MSALINYRTPEKSIDETPMVVVKKRYNIRKTSIPLTLKSYNTGKAIISSYKMPEIKAACKLYKVKVTGTKPVLVKRLHECFIQTNAATVIQSGLRRRIVLRWKQLHGPAFNDVSICVNQTDFVSMEPLDEIDKRYIYSYTDCKHFTYGFHILSLIQLVQNDASPVNPYNRDPFNFKDIDNIIFMYNTSILLCSELTPEHKLHIRPEYNLRNIETAAHSRNSARLTILNETPTGYNVESSYANYCPIVNPLSIMHISDATRLNRIHSIRQQPLTTRVRDVFIEIDRLGNYTNQQWFSSLNSYEFATLYRTLYNIWNYRAGLSRDVKMLISPFHNPFDGIFPHITMHDQVSVGGLKMACLIVFENMIYSGVNDEYRRIGAFHALSALTIVSRGARHALPWLHESLV